MKLLFALLLLAVSAFSQTCPCPPPPPPPPSPIQLPVEVVGLDGTVKIVSFSLPAVAGATTLSMQIHGLKYETEASVQVNNSAWLPITSSTVNILGLGKAYGGIGGGFHTLSLTMALPAGSLTTGKNSISFRFNGTNGTVSGFRVLAFNFLDASGGKLLPDSSFAAEDPNTWTPPFTDAVNIAAGKNLFYNAPLNVPTATGIAAIMAKCTSCHAQDGRDLKYFNYSNNSIRTRAMFHGLTPLQGDQIASYIRSLKVPNPGRVWNPPYQPGPGLDAQPVANWSAGAGLSAVLERDVDMWAYLTPGGSFANWGPTANMNVREMPIALQLPDWNSWLPTTHPVDGFGAAFTSNILNTNYLAIRNTLLPNSPQAYMKAHDPLALWALDDQNFLGPRTKPSSDPLWATSTYTDSIFSVRQWSITKQWELNQEFGLEGMAPVIFGAGSEPRAWFTQMPFIVSPNIIHLPDNAVGFVHGNNLPITTLYVKFIWYHTQAILNGRGIAPAMCCDYPYTFDHIQALAYTYLPNGTNAHRQGGLMSLWLVHGLQMTHRQGPGPEATSQAGWSPTVGDLSRFYRYSMWTDFTPANKVAAMTTYMQNWLSEVNHFTPQQFYTGGWTTPSTVPDLQNYWNGFASSTASSMRLALCQGVSPALVDQMATWAATVWPAYPSWHTLPPASCAQ